MKTILNVTSFHRLKIIQVIIALGLCAGIPFYLFGNANAAYLNSSGATISITPSVATISGCETIQVSVMVEDIAEFYAADIRLSFDPDVLEVIDADPSISGVQIEQGSFLQPDFVVYNSADNTSGTIRYALTQVNPTLPANGSGVLAILHFKAKTAGNSDVSITSVGLADRDGAYISTKSVDGIVLTIPPSGTTLAISQVDDTTAQLSWSAATDAATYHLYRDTAPYFTPGETAYQTLSGLIYQDVGALGDVDTNYYYVVKTACENGFKSNMSNRVGEFDFEIIRDAYNTVALPLIDPGLSTADDLGNVVDAATVSRWNAATQSFATRTVGVSGNDFSLTTGQGYFLYTPGSGNTVFTTVGNVPVEGSITFSITRGDSCQLNLISLPLDQAAITTADELAISIGGIPTISRWRADTNTLQTRTVGISGNNFPALIGYPYWPCADNSGSNASWPIISTITRVRLSTRK